MLYKTSLKQRLLSAKSTGKFHKRRDKKQESLPTLRRNLDLGKEFVGQVINLCRTDSPIWTQDIAAIWRCYLCCNTNSLYHITHIDDIKVKTRIKRYLILHNTMIKLHSRRCMTVAMSTYHSRRKDPHHIYIVFLRKFPSQLFRLILCNGVRISGSTISICIFGDRGGGLRKRQSRTNIHQSFNSSQSTGLEKISCSSKIWLNDLFLRIFGPSLVDSGTVIHDIYILHRRFERINIEKICRD